MVATARNPPSMQTVARLQPRGEVLVDRREAVFRGERDANARAALRVDGGAQPLPPRPLIIFSSARRLAKPRKSVSSRPQSSSQCDGVIPTPSVPARMRSMKPAEMMNTSSSTMCLRPIE